MTSSTPPKTAPTDSQAPQDDPAKQDTSAPKKRRFKIRVKWRGRQLPRVKPRRRELTPTVEPRLTRGRWETKWTALQHQVKANNPLTPDHIGGIKLLILTPLISLSLPIPQVGALIDLPKWGTLALFALYISLDLISAIHRAKMSSPTPLEDGEEAPPIAPQSSSKRMSWDRLADAPLCAVTAWVTAPLLGWPLLISHFILERLTELLRVRGRGPQRSRALNALHEMTLFALIALSLGWGERLITPDRVLTILVIHISLLGLTLAYQSRLLQKRFIADTLSLGNLLCGCMSIYCSSQHAYNASLLYLLLGAAFDGFDGAAARKFGGTKWGVYSDDIADGVNYGIAPGYALYTLLGAYEGLIIGCFYAFFTLSRLLFFTLNKDESDPNYFSGIPSPVGGMIVMCGIVLFRDQPTWVTFLVGIACTQMVSFSTHYRHLGRALSPRSRRARIGAPAYLFIFIIGASLGGVKGAATVVLVTAFGYGFLPSALSFINLFTSPKSS